jgi:ketosteroid isomerase-like protein
MNRISVVLFVGLLSVSAHAQTGDNSAKAAEVQKTMNTFIQAFTNLDWEPFRAAFADDATVFYPRAIPRRADGRADFEHNFRQVFEQIRNGRTKGPYFEVQPRDLKIQIAGDVAIVTFHLDDKPGFVNRRSVILQRRAGNWKIIHLHASEVAAP